LERQNANRLRIIAGVLLVAAVVAVILMTFAFDQSRLAQNNASTATVAQGEAVNNAETSVANAATATVAQGIAESESRIAESGRIAVQSLLELSDNRVDTALLLSMGALNIADTREARSSLLTSLQAVPQLITFLYAHSVEVQTVEYSPDGTLFASADDVGVIILWDAVTHEPLRELSGHSANIWDIAFNADGTLLASADNVGEIRLWHPATGESAGDVLSATSEPVYAIAFSPDGALLASGHYDGIVRVWDVENGAVLQEIDAQNGVDVFAIAFSPDGTLLAAGGGDNVITLWNVSDLNDIQPTFTLSGHTNWVRTLAFSPDGAMLASGGFDTTVRLWDVASGEALRQPLTDHRALVWSVAFSSDGLLLASASADRTIILREASSGRRVENIAPLIGHADEVQSVAFSPDSTLLVSGGKDGRVLLWHTQPQTPLSTEWHVVLEEGETFEVGGILSIAVSPDGTQVISGSSTGSVGLWQTYDGASSCLGLPPGAEVTGVNYSPNGEWFAFATAAGHAEWWNRITAQPGPALNLDTALRTIVFTPDSLGVATAGDDGVIRLWGVTNGEEITQFVGHEGVVSTLAFNPDGTLLASGGYDHRIMLWDMANPSAPPAILENEQLNFEVMSVTFSHDGRLLAAAYRGALVLWDVATRAIVGQPLVGHDAWVLSVAFSPDDTLLASGGDDDVIILWDVATQQPIGTPLTGHTDWVWSVVFNPDGQTLYSGSRDTTIRAWNISLEAWRGRACDIANRDLDAAEWARFFGAGDYQPICAVQG
jgi:WD40 repeat protein